MRVNPYLVAKICDRLIAMMKMDLPEQDWWMDYAEEAERIIR